MFFGKIMTVKQQDSLDPYIEVLGCVDQDLTITVERIVNYGTDFGGCGSCMNI